MTGASHPIVQRTMLWKRSTLASLSLKSAPVPDPHRRKAALVADALRLYASDFGNHSRSWSAPVRGEAKLTKSLLRQSVVFHAPALTMRAEKERYIALCGRLSLQVLEYGVGDQAVYAHIGSLVDVFAPYSLPTPEAAREKAAEIWPEAMEGPPKFWDHVIGGGNSSLYTVNWQRAAAAVIEAVYRYVRQEMPDWLVLAELSV